MPHSVIAQLDDLPVGGMKLIKAEGKRIVLIRTSDGVFALDNACPHEGYGLTQGDLNVETGELTCAWHNWKFRVADGRCVLGEESARSYPLEVVDGRVLGDLADPPAEALRPKLLARLRRSFADDYVGSTARSVVRLLRADANPVELIWEAVQWGAPRAEFGWGHALASAVDCIDLLDRYDGDERAHPIVQAMAGITEVEHRRPTRPQPEPTKPAELPADVPSTFRALVEAEQYEPAEALVMGAIDAGVERDVIERALIGAVSDHHLGYGHLAIYTQKAFTLLDHIGWERAGTVLPHLAFAIMLATREDKLPYMRPFLRVLDGVDVDALAVTSASPQSGWRGEHGVQLRAALLGRDKRAPAQAAVDALAAGAGVDALLDEVVLAASERLLRYDPTVDFDLHEDFGWLDITHAITYAHAARWAWRRQPGPDTVRLALFTAFLVHYTGRAEWQRPSGPPDTVLPDATVGDLFSAVTDRRADDAVAHALALTPHDAAGQLERAALTDRAGSFIVAAHLIKTSHAAVHEAAATGSALPVAAAARFCAAPRLERFVARSVTASIDFLSGRGPADKNPTT